MTEGLYSAIDSGTTVSISADGKLAMNGFDPRSPVNIMGSPGSGDLVRSSHILEMGVASLFTFSEFIRF